MLALVPSSDPVLRARAAEVDSVLIQVIPHLLAMRRFMHKKDGAGLAAPQLGIPLRFFISIIPGAELVINPRVLSMSEPFSIMSEGCLSLPGYTTPVRRSDDILADWTDQLGRRQQARLTEYAARIFQHETDHLNGICIFP